LRVRRIRNALVVSPRLRSVQAAEDNGAELRAIRRWVADLWWEAGLQNMSVFVPAFERPAVDSLYLTLRSTS
jgi:hypothetical protein